MRYLNIALFCFVLLSFPVQAKAQTSSSVEIYVFHIQECPACGGILHGYLPDLQSRYPFLEVKTFDVGNPSLYEALVRLEQNFGREGREFPVLFIGDQLLSGEAEIREKLEPLILEFHLRGAVPLPPIHAALDPPPSERTFSVDLAYFYQKGCSKCDRTTYLLKYLSNKYPRLNTKEIDVNTPDGKRLNETLSIRLNLPAEKRLTVPSIFIGQDVLLPGEITEARVEALIRKYEKTEDPSPLTVGKEEMEKAEESMITRFKSLGVLTVLSAGLIDGVNPCAFATVIFFISYLTFVGRKRSEIFWVGLGFSGAVFTTYLLIGLGILSFIQHFSFMPLLSKIVYLITFMMLLVLGIYSFFDYVRVKRGRSSRMKLQLPDFLKKRIHQVIREKSGSHHYFFAAVGAGVIISFLEFTCTGQVYLPTILFVTHIPSFRMSALSYLLLYNLMFIIPLLIIFGAAYWGVTSERFSFFLQKRVSTIKLLTSLLFFTLAGILMAGLF